MIYPTLPVGTISEGTRHMYDLCCASMATFEALQTARGESLGAFTAHQDIVDTTPNGAWHDRDHDWWQTEHATELFDDIDALLNDWIPDYCYLGMHDGDGALFGVWVDMSYVSEDIQSGELASGPEVPENFGGLFAQISDHGNCTLYIVMGGESRELWAIV